MTEKSDGELLDLYEQRDGLTEMAQQALAGSDAAAGAEYGWRRCDGCAGAGRGSGEEVEEDTLEGDEVLAYLFHDAFQAREAIRLMTEAGIEHRMLDWHVVQPERPVVPSGTGFGVGGGGRADLQSTLQVLKDKLGLFPGAEGEDAPEDGDSMEVLSMYERGRRWWRRGRWARRR